MNWDNKFQQQPKIVMSVQNEDPNDYIPQFTSSLSKDIDPNNQYDEEETIPIYHSNKQQMQVNAYA